jgi:hypothetical protein
VIWWDGDSWFMNWKGNRRYGERMMPDNEDDDRHCDFLQHHCLYTEEELGM